MIDKNLCIISHKYHIKKGNTFVVKGGFKDLTNEIARHFQSVNLCVPVAHEESLGKESRYPYHENIRITSLPSFRGRKELLHNLWDVVVTMNGVVRKADVVYCMGPNDVGVLGMVIARLQGAKMFASLDTDRAGNVLRRDYSNRLVKYSKYSANKYFLYPLIRAACRHVPVFVTGDMFMGNYPEWMQWVKTTIRKNQIPPLSLSRPCQEPIHVVFAGRLSPVKNIDSLIRAVNKLDGSGLRLKCTIIGSGSLEKNLRQLVRCIDAPVEFAGQLPNADLIDSRFLGADIFVLPSLEERQGKVLLEAMACSIPVVASRVGGIPSVVDHGVNGLLCNPKNVEDIAQKIIEVGLDSNLRKRLIRNGYTYAKQHALDVEVERLINQVAQYHGFRLKCDNVKE